MGSQTHSDLRGDGRNAKEFADIFKITTERYKEKFPQGGFSELRSEENRKSIKGWSG